MDITEQVTTTKTVGYICDLCKKENRGNTEGKGTLHQTLDDGCDFFYRKWVDLCMRCTGKVFEFIEEQGGAVNSDY